MHILWNKKEVLLMCTACPPAGVRWSKGLLWAEPRHSPGTLMVTQGPSHGLWSNQSVRGQPLCGLCGHCDKDHLSHERPKELLHCKEGAFHKQWEMDEKCKHVSFPYSLINGQGVFCRDFSFITTPEPLSVVRTLQQAGRSLRQRRDRSLIPLNLF